MKINPINYSQNTFYGKQKPTAAYSPKVSKRPKGVVKKHLGVRTPSPVQFQITISGKELAEKVRAAEKTIQQRKHQEELRTYQPMETVVKGFKLKGHNYLDTLAKLNKSKLSRIDMMQMMNYINSADKNEVKGKLNCLLHLPKVVEKGLGIKLFKDKKNGDFFDCVGNNTYRILLKSDLFGKDGPTDDFKIACRKIKKFISPSLFDRSSAESISMQKKIAPYLGETLLLGSMVPSGTFENIICDKTALFESTAQKIELLNKDDIKFIRNASHNAVVVDEQTYEVYPISDSDIVKLINLITFNNDLKNHGYKGIDINSKEYIKTSQDIEPNFTVDIERMQHNLLPDALMSNGVDKNTMRNYMEKYNMALLYSKENNTKPSRKVFWDTNFVYLMNGLDLDYNTKSIIKTMTERVANPKESDYDTKQMFLDYITNEKFSYKEKNERTKQIFAQNNLNYEKWIDGDFDATNANFTNILTPQIKNTKRLTTKMWNRIPQESIFDGNYIASSGTLEESKENKFSEYMLDTLVNIIETKNERGETVGMARIFMAKVDNKPSLIIDKIETRDAIQNRYLYDKKSRKEYRNMIASYADKVAMEINEDYTRTIPVYFMENKTGIKGLFDDLAPCDTKKIKPIGDTLKFLYPDINKNCSEISDSSNGIHQYGITVSNLIDANSQTD